VVSITVGGHLDSAFVSLPPPPNREVPSRQRPLIAAVRQLAGRLDGVDQSPLSPRLLSPFAQRDATGSSRIAGTCATLREPLFEEHLHQ
jgi:hypothetical protein